MSENAPFYISERYLRWTPSAIECYERGCVCEGCPVSKILETKCIMKKTVIMIVRLHGKPPKNEKLDILKVYDLIHDGKNLKQIAKILKVPYQTLLKKTKQYGINGYLLKQDYN